MSSCQRIGDELRAEGGAANTNEQEVAKFSRRRGNIAGMDISGELFNSGVGFFDVPAQGSTRR